MEPETTVTAYPIDQQTGVCLMPAQAKVLTIHDGTVYALDAAGAEAEKVRRKFLAYLTGETIPAGARHVKSQPDPEDFTAVLHIFEVPA